MHCAVSSIDKPLTITGNKQSDLPGFSRNWFSYGFAEPTHTAIALICSEDNQVGLILFEITKNCLDRIVLLCDYLAHVDAKLANGGLRTSLCQQPPSFQCFTHTGKVGPLRRASR